MPEPWSAPLRHALLVGEELITHIIAGTIVLAGGLWFHIFLEANGDPKAYDLVPWRYVVDTGDLAILIALVVFAIQKLKRMNEEEHR